MVLEKQKEERRRSAFSQRFLKILKSLLAKQTLQKATETCFLKENILNGFQFCANNDQGCCFRKSCSEDKEKWRWRLNSTKISHLKMEWGTEQPDRIHSIAGQEPERKRLLFPYRKPYFCGDGSDPMVTNVITKGQGGVPMIWNYIYSNPAVRRRTLKIMWMPQRPTEV